MHSIDFEALAGLLIVILAVLLFALRLRSEFSDSRDSCEGCAGCSADFEALAHEIVKDSAARGSAKNGNA